MKDAGIAGAAARDGAFQEDETVMLDARDAAKPFASKAGKMEFSDEAAAAAAAATVGLIVKV